MNIVIIVLFVFILILLYILFINYASAYTLVSSPIFLKNGGSQIPKDYITNNSNLTSSYSVWVYLNKKIESNKTGTIFQLNNKNGYLDYK